MHFSIRPNDIEDRSNFVFGVVAGFLLSVLVTIVSYRAVFTPLPKVGESARSVVQAAMSHDLRILGYPMLVGGPLLIITMVALFISLYNSKAPEQPLVAVRYIVRLLIVIFGDLALPFFLLQGINPQTSAGVWLTGVVSILWVAIWTLLVGFFPLKPPKKHRKD